MTSAEAEHDAGDGGRTLADLLSALIKEVTEQEKSQHGPSGNPKWNDAEICAEILERFGGGGDLTGTE